MKKNYVPGSMSFMEGFFATMPSVGFMMELDEEKARNIVNGLIAEGRDVVTAEIGLDGDWQCNSSTIYNCGEFSEYTEYRRSKWAKPILMVYFNDGPSEMYEVWKIGENIN